MLQQFKTYITQQKLFNKEDKILLAVSGGMDSVVMAHLFHASKINFGIAHCNFKLRGKESDADEQFVKTVAAKLKADFHSTSFNTEQEAKTRKASIQMAARELRYHFFEQTCRLYQYSCVAVAHHAGDSAETVLLNLIRGTGIAGYHGITSKNKNIIRPLLFASREDISAYAKKNKLTWCEDSSNQSDYYVRNKIRLRVIPLLEQINPSVISSLQRHARQMGETEMLYREYILLLKNKLLQAKGNNFNISIIELKKHVAFSTLLFEILRDFNFNSDTVFKIAESFDSTSGKHFFSETHQLIKDRDTLIISEKVKSKRAEYFIPENTHFYDWERNKITIRVLTLTIDLKEKIISGKLKDRRIACFDADKINFPLVLRKWQKGDYFYPLGMKGKKLLSDYFTDAKFSIPEKENTWLLLSGKKIVWVINHRMDERFKIKKETNNCIQLTFETL